MNTRPKVRFPQEFSRYKVTTHDPSTGAWLETTRDYTGKAAGLAITSESESWGYGGPSEEARLAHIKALKTKWPDINEKTLVTTIAAREAGESEEKRLAFVRRALRPHMRTTKQTSAHAKLQGRQPGL